MRIDSWLWTTRFFKSRSQATQACRAGQVRLNGQVVKAAAEVKPGDRIGWRDQLRPRQVEVVQLLPRRVSPSLAVEAYIDHSPPPPDPAERMAVGLRPRGAGRPEKKDRRDLDRWRGFQR
ncbi:MAG: RNA-binding S4 domain-containing protein [Propionibacteriaceae bacterium]|jgi:ribosome-associated heat shock protein Hsp15|nr:RNA-binding S4 domain-containing protein [Propionibacteriaceae bacterium]